MYSLYTLRQRVESRIAHYNDAFRAANRCVLLSLSDGAVLEDAELYIQFKIRPPMLPDPTDDTRNVYDQVPVSRTDELMQLQPHHQPRLLDGKRRFRFSSVD